MVDRHIVPLSLRVWLFKDYKYYVPKNSKICHYHLNSDLWHELPALEDMIHEFTVEHIEDFASFVTYEGSTLDFENIHLIEEHMMWYFMGMSKSQFNSLMLEVPRLAQMHRSSTALAVYLMKLRTGDSNERISSLLKIPRSTLERLMAEAREKLHQDFVPLNLGLGHITREQIAERNLTIPNGLFGEINGVRKPVVIIDGTYIYVQKSSNYLYQKETYSLHKYRNLVKPFMLVCSDGYIIEVLGPYPATTSDAQIMINEFSDPHSPMREYFQDGDVFILDRGFRDAIPLLESCNYSAHMPSSLQENEFQLSTLEANKNRKITICRWVVEVVNGIFKQQYKIFRQEFFNKASQHLMIDFSIAAALINRFHSRIVDRPDALDILQIVNANMYVENRLGDYVIHNHLNRRRAHFQNINVDDNNLVDFPHLTYSEMILIACGTYQLKQARSYYGEHRRFNGMYRIEVCREINNVMLEVLDLPRNSYLLRGKIQSRHISQKIYFVYIIVNNSLSGKDALQHRYCNCLVGRRTVGTCAHIMSIIWYLAWARHQSNIYPPAQFLDDLLIVYNDE